MIRFVSCNPFSNLLIKQFPTSSPSHINQQIKRVHQSFLINSSFSLKNRSEYLLKISQILRDNITKYAQLITNEIGKPISHSRLQVLKSAQLCQYYSKNTQHLLRNIHVKGEAKNCQIKYEPLGVIHLVIPINYHPFWMNFKWGIPIIAGGNSLLVRNSRTTSLIGMAVQQLLQHVFDFKVYQPVHSDYRHFQQIMKNQLIMGVSFAGSAKTASVIGQIAGKFRKKSLLILPGNDPMVVMFPSNFLNSIENTIRAYNSGQTIIAPQKYIIHIKIYDQFKQRLIQKIQKLKIGNPLNQYTQIGPMARPELLTMFNKHIENLPKPYFSKINQPPFASFHVIDMDSVYQPYIYGPVFSLYKYRKQEEILQIANKGRALGCSIWGEKQQALQLSRKIKSGMVSINQITKSDIRLPLGGVDGFGRQSGQEGIRYFTNVRSYSIN